MYAELTVGAAGYQIGKINTVDIIDPLAVGHMEVLTCQIDSCVLTALDSRRKQ